MSSAAVEGDGLSTMSQAGPFLPTPNQAKQIIRTVGRRNLAYAAGTVALATLASVTEGLTHGFEGGIVMAAMILWVGGSFLCFGLNALLVLGWVSDQLRGGVPMIAAPVSHALIGCALPVAAVVFGGALMP